MRPRLCSDVRFVECPDGAYIHSDHGACTFRGRHAYAWLSRLAPVLTGEHTVAELTTGLSADKREMVESLVRRLAEQRFVIDVGTARAHGLSESELRVYADEMAFIGYALDSPEWRFERLRRTRLALVGEGPLLRALLTAFAGSGWRDITVFCPDNTDIKGVAERAFRDAAQSVEVVRLDGGAARTAAARSGGMVVQVADDIGELVAMCRACDRLEVPLAQALVRGAEVWLSGVGVPARTAAESGWHRLAALPGGAPRHPEQDRLIGPVPDVIAAAPALACFSHVTGLDRPARDGQAPSGDPEFTHVDLRNLDMVPHRFLRHPRAAGPAPPDGPDEVLAAVARLESAAPVAAEELMERAARAVDPRLGLLGLLDEQGLTQTPLAVCRATISDPYGALPRWAAPPEAIGWGADRATARLRCLLAALAAYGGLATRGAAAGGPGNGLVAGVGGDEAVVWGVELPAGRPCAVPVSALPPVAAPYRPPVGAGAGLSWTQALAAGLRGHCEALAGDRLAGAGRPAAPREGLGPAVPADLLRMGERGAYLGRQLDLTGERPDVHEGAALLDVPAYVFTDPGRTPVVSSAGTPERALEDGLERSLLRWQARTARQSAYADAAPHWYDAADHAAVRVMAEALRAAGHVPVAVPLRHDAEAVALLPFVAQIVLREARGGDGDDD